MWNQRMDASVVLCIEMAGRWDVLSALPEHRTGLVSFPFLVFPLSLRFSCVSSFVSSFSWLSKIIHSMSQSSFLSLNFCQIQFLPASSELMIWISTAPRTTKLSLSPFPNTGIPSWSDANFAEHDGTANCWVSPQNPPRGVESRVGIVLCLAFHAT